MNARDFRVGMMAPTPWTADEWQAIVWDARNVRAPRPHVVLRLTARGSAQRSAARLRELALQTEIRNARGAS